MPVPSGHGSDPVSLGKKFFPHFKGPDTLKTAGRIVSCPYFHVVGQRPVFYLKGPVIPGVDGIRQGKGMGNAHNSAVSVDGTDSFIDFFRLHASPVGITVFLQHHHMAVICGPLQSPYRQNSFLRGQCSHPGHAGGGVVVGERQRPVTISGSRVHQCFHGKGSVTVTGMGMQFNRIPAHRKPSLQ